MVVWNNLQLTVCRANQIIASPASSDDFKASMVFGLLQKGMELVSENWSALSTSITRIICQSSL